MLPDHFHVIIKPVNIDEYPQIISLIKTSFSRKIDIAKIEGYKLSKSRANKYEKDIWQRRYWEHTIRDEEDLNKHIDYIHYNPVKHKLVKNVKDWEYSTFHKFVKSEQYNINWGSGEDITKIELIDLE